MSYIVVGNEVIDSQEFYTKIKENYHFKRVKDLTKGAKREDTLIYQIFHDINQLKEELDIDNIKDLSEEELIDELMELADEKVAVIEDIMPATMLCYSYSYHYDEAEDEIKTIFITVDKIVGELRLSDIAERILRSID
ncbi:hypothetical protein [Alkaliphilus peptidifermentans]|uniref:Uncharacterized protein n=1 Tax=Alkaliphilus peptidifermentans DSM 18978 TaxID=1120976 RepID=A0A1G5ATE1_9FIRM|nr:hypothetical protein [Alkaliphilus peptidifermentans]SCX81099.1 hypothetical protein SAMN03080606_00281 [Alkaliphilus peptidifermentans DSM 18978]